MHSPDRWIASRHQSQGACEPKPFGVGLAENHGVIKPQPFFTY